MSSICVGDLKRILDQFPNDYEVVMEIRDRVNGKIKTSIAYINGIREVDDWYEVRLMN